MILVLTDKLRSVFKHPLRQTALTKQVQKKQKWNLSQEPIASKQLLAKNDYLFDSGKFTTMTSVSAYRVYRTRCCHLVLEEPLYSSSNTSTQFAGIPSGRCECGTPYVFEDLEFVGIKKIAISDLALVGIEEITIPSFMRIK